MRDNQKTPKNSHFCSNDGLTLLELLIALVVIAVSFLALSFTQIGSLTTTARAADTSQAKEFANRTFEGVRKTITLNVLNATTKKAEWEKYGGSTTTTPITDGCPVISNTSATPGAQCQGTATEENYSATWRVGPSSGPTPVSYQDEGIAEIHVLVQWQYRGTPRTLSFIDYVSCLDISAEICPDPRHP